jgi:protein TonB
MRKTSDSLFIYFIISALVHFGALSLSFHAKEKRIFMSAPIDVSFYAPSEQVVTPPPPETVEEPIPEQVKEEVKEVPVTKEDVVVKNKEKPKHKPKPKQKPKVKEPEPPVKPQPQENKVQTVQAPANEETRYAATGTQFEGLAFDTANFKYAYYTNTIIKSIGRRWQWSESYGRLRALVYFRILKDGSATSIELKESSGDESFDKNAERSVQLASPFAPLPDGYSGDSLGVYFEFKYR